MLDTTLPADSVEFCPHPDALDILVCGTYKLVEKSDLHQSTVQGISNETERLPSKPQHRYGQCLVLQIDRKDAGLLACRHLQSIDLPAILDMKWCHNSPFGAALLSIGNSEGGVTLHEWQPDTRILGQTDTVLSAPAGTLCLSLDWSNRRDGNNSGSLVVSLSNGSLCLLSPSQSSYLSLTNSWYAHEHEPWIAAWNYWDTNVIYSGGDDLKMKGWDIRQDLSTPIFTNRRFEAGITSIQSHPHIEHLFAVGSYDNTVRLFDTRKPLTAVSEANVGGGAWRVKWHPSASRRGDLLVACMHDGVKILRFDMVAGVGETIKHFDSHQSMVYGADWSYMPAHRGVTTISSCSFYDHVLHLWDG